jgi:hypothetical protein
MKRKTFRLRFTFWLDMTKPDEENIAETIDHLKAERSFVRTVRDGIRLICDLRAGRLDVLFELFPWVQAEFLEHKTSTGTNGNGDNTGELKRQIERLEQLLLQQNSGPIMAPVGGPKPMNVPQVAGPAVDDDEDITGLLSVKKAKSDGKSAQNFLDSAFAVAGLQ